MTDAAKAIRDSIEQRRAHLKARHLEALRQRITEALNREPGIRASVYVFGSWASDRFDACSDTDLLAVVPDHSTAPEVERRLMQIADDVVVVSDREWERRLAHDDAFWRRVAHERLPVADTRSDDR